MPSAENHMERPPRRAGYLAYVARAAQMAVVAHREGRLTASPSRWLIDLRHLWSVMRRDLTPAHQSGAPPDTEPPRVARPTLEDARSAHAASSRAALDAFLAGGSRLHLPRPARPSVSIVIVLFNRAELTLRCLQSIASNTALATEVVIVDNASTDETAALLERLDGPVLFGLAANEGYLRGCNLGVKASRAPYVLLLNSDAEVEPGTIEAALGTIERDGRIGAVGGRLVLPDGTLQEAGSIIWSDGSSVGYGRGDDPDSFAYAFSRDVDYCSAAFLLTRRRLYESLGGFDEAYAPAYYEDADYCARLWQAGYRVVYEPRAVVRHVEFGSSESSARSTAAQLERRAVFRRVHAAWLAHQHEATPARPLIGRSHGASKRLLLFDDRVPRAGAGSGMPRALEIVRSLVALGWDVTLYPLWILDEPWSSVYEELPRNVEVASGLGAAGARAFLEARTGFYDAVIVSRSHNVRRLRVAMGPAATWCPGTPLVFDAEAVQSVRERLRAALESPASDDEALERARREELGDLEAMDAIWTVSALERDELARSGRPVHVVTHAVRVSPGSRPFEARRGLLFVGAFGPESPNTDSVQWFCARVLPTLAERLGDLTLTVAGHAPPDDVLALASPLVRVLADVPDLGPLYDEARVVVAPTRFAAGIPLKVLHAAGYGVPVVCTSLLTRQLGWSSGIEVLAADDPQGFTEACVRAYTDEACWQRLRESALARVRSDHSPDAFVASVARALDGLRSVRTAREGTAS